MNKQIAATGLFLFSFLLPLRAWAASFSQVYVFGDSLSDQSNVFNLSGSPPPPYFNGRFSNGPNWIDYLSQDLGLNPTPYTTVALGGVIPTQGINFAFGGATTGTDNTISTLLPGLQQQVGFFQNFAQTYTPAADALYILWGGANDYLPTESSFVPYTEPTTTIGNLSQALSTLASVGAKNFLVVNLPDLGNTPLLNNTSAFSAFNTLTQAHNSSLSAALSNLSQSLGSDVNITSVDVNSLFSEAINNPQQFGFTNVTDACLNNIQCVTNPNVQKQFLFWDQRHPTTTTHEIIADRALEQIPEPSFVLGMVTFAAFVGAGKMRQRKS